MARALIVGCGCRGRELGVRLVADGWQVRGTTRDESRLASIEAAGLEAVVADPDRIGTVLEWIEGVTLLFWLLGSADGAPYAVAALHGPRLERLLEELVDTPVRGVVYEHTGAVPADVAGGAMEILRVANERWRIPFEVVDASPADLGTWLAGMTAAARQLISG